MRWKWRRAVHRHCKWWWAWAKNHWRFSIGSDTEHVVEAALKIVHQTNSWWGRIPDRGYSLSKSLEVWNSRSLQGIWSILLLKCGTQGTAGRETRVTDLCAMLKSLNFILVKVTLVLIRLRNGDEESVGLMRHEGQPKEAEKRRNQI